MNPKTPRHYDTAYLTWLRVRYCVACGKPPPSDAAHIRSACEKFGKRATGMAEKPDDKWAVPLCRSCHLSQHAFGSELDWWRLAGIDPFVTALAYYERFGGTGGKPKRKRTTIKPRLPREQRAKIKSRGFR